MNPDNTRFKVADKPAEIRAAFPGCRKIQGTFCDWYKAHFWWTGTHIAPNCKTCSYPLRGK